VAIAKFDGTDAPVMGAAVPSSRAYTIIDDHTFDVLNKVDGKVMTRNRSVVSRDGRIRTVTQKGVDERGRPIDNVQVFVRQ
jgi:hypothetical protein